MAPLSNHKLEITLGVVVLVILSALIWGLVQMRGGTGFGMNRYEIIFDDVIGLNQDNPVTIAGVKVGVIREINVDGEKARVLVSIDPKVKVHNDASASVRAKSLLGEKYIALHPGHKDNPLLPEGAPIAQHSKTVDVDKAIREAGGVIERINEWTTQLDPKVLDILATKISSILDKGDKASERIAKLVHSPELSATYDSALQTLQETKIVLKNLNQLLSGLSWLDEKSMRELLEIDGVKVRLFSNANAEKRFDVIERLPAEK